MNLFPDSSVFIQIANFLFLLFLLNFILYRPIRNIISQRNQEIEGLEKSVEEFEESSARNEQGIEDSIVQARREGFSERESIRNKGLEEESAIIQQINASIEEKRSKSMQEMEARMEEVRKALEAEVAGLSNDLAEKILGRSIQ